MVTGRELGCDDGLTLRRISCHLNKGGTHWWGRIPGVFPVSLDTDGRRTGKRLWWWSCHRVYQWFLGGGVDTTEPVTPLMDVP